MAWANNPFDLPYYQAWYLVIMMISLSYVTVAPIVTLMGAVYMNMRYQVDKYNICTLFYFDFESKGTTPRKAVNFLIICLFFMQVLGGFMLFGEAHVAYYVIGTLFVVVAVVLLIVALCCSDRIFKTEEPQLDSKPINVDKAVEMYTHPLLKESGGVKPVKGDGPMVSDKDQD